MARGTVLGPARGQRRRSPLVPGLPHPENEMDGIFGSSVLSRDKGSHSGSLAGDSEVLMAACKREAESRVGKDNGEGDYQHNLGSSKHRLKTHKCAGSTPM